MNRFVKHLSIVAVVLAAAPAQAAVNYGVMCEGSGNFKQLIREGTGNRELLRGIGSVAGWCESTKSVQMIRVGLEGPALDTLNFIAAMPAADDVLVATLVEWSDGDDTDGTAKRHAIGWNKERTFGELRKELNALSKPTGEYVNNTGYRSYHSDKCPEPLIPIRYYIATKAPFPGCDGGRLIQDGQTTTTFD